MGYCWHISVVEGDIHENREPYEEGSYKGHNGAPKQDLPYIVYARFCAYFVEIYGVMDEFRQWQL